MRLLRTVEEQHLLLDGVVTLQVAFVVLFETSALRVAGRVGRKQQLLGLAGEHVLLVVDLSVGALVLDIATFDEDMRTFSQLVAHKAAFIVLRIEVVDGGQLKSFTF